MKRIAPILIIISGILWGTMGIFVHYLNDYGIESINIVAIRSYGSVIFLFLILLIYNKKLFFIKIKDIWCFIGTGCMSIIFFNYCYFRTIEITSMSVAAVLLYTAPAFVLILSNILFKEKITKWKGLSLVLVVIGCIFVTGIIGNESVLSTKGIIVGLGAGFGYALYSIFSRFALNKGYNSLTISFYTFVFASIGLIPQSKYNLIIKFSVSSINNVVFIILFALLSTIIPYFTYTLGLKYIENGKASIIASVEPVAATIMGFILYGEKLKISTAVGIILVLLSILISNIQFDGNNENK